jgi:hypothetical protein
MKILTGGAWPIAARRSRSTRWMPQLMIPLLAAYLFALTAMAASPDGERIKPPVDPSLFDSVAPEACEQWPTRVFARTKLGTECVEFYATAISEPVPVAVFNFHGDFREEVLSSPNAGRAIMGRLNLAAEAAASRYGMPFINMSRPGVLNSTGEHTKRRELKEYASMSAAIDQIKARFGIQKIAIAGQSGGGSIVAGLLALGRSDIVCAAPGSGAFDLDKLAEMRARSEDDRAKARGRLFSPADHIEKIVKDAARRIFVIGDPRDSNTFFVQQREYAERLASAHHHAVLLYAPAADVLRHGVSQFAMDIAGMCASGRSDADIAQYISDGWQRAISKPAAKPAANPTAPAVDSAPPPQGGPVTVKPAAPAGAPAPAP